MAKIAFVNTLKVPSGEASVNRVLSLSKGLFECGDEVHILSSNINPEFANGEELNGIKIHNLGKRKGILGLSQSLARILNHIRKNHYDVLISTTNSLLLIYPLAIVCRLTGTKFVQEKSEFPFSLMKKGLLNRIYGKLYANTTYKLMDAMIIMTRPLLEYFRGKVRRDCKFIHVPMTVDSSRFEIPKQSTTVYGDYIAYCGNMSGNKDGVENLIDAFSYVLKETSSLKLLLIGGTNDVKEFNALKEKAANISDSHILFYGRADRDEIPGLLKNAYALALARPSSLQSTGGFPTKLGEYLSTGNPVIVTAVGDIPSYLNSTNSYLVEPDNNEAFGNAILSSLKNPQEAMSKGKMGLKLAKEVFDYKAQTKKLHDFFHSLS